ncbi:serine/threonine protein kinase [Colletotrichum higginsianum]|nr:serine/threonine protein kinase [Colletotrichum higginsianum]
MDTITPDTLQRHRAAAESFGSESLLVLQDGTTVDLASGYIPLLARFTHEDKAAKGLRKRSAGDKPEPPIYFSALELVRDNELLLLTGSSGSGKTTFAKHLCFRLATSGFGHARPLVRNDFGDTREEAWGSGRFLPCYFAVDNPHVLQTLVGVTIPALISTASKEGQALMVVIDTNDGAADASLDLLRLLFSSFVEHKKHKLLLLGTADVFGHSVLPPSIVRHALLPLLEAPRRQTVLRHLGPEFSESLIATGSSAETPALFALALQAQDRGDRAEELLDSWLSIALPGAAQTLTENAYNRISQGQPLEASNHRFVTGMVDNPAVSCSVVQQLLAARHLAELPVDIAVGLFRQHPQAHTFVIKSCLVRLSASGRSDDLVEGLLGGSPADGQRGALLVADLVGETEKFRDRVANLMLDIVSQGTLPASQRKKAGRILSRLGDPRDLTLLAEVPAGSFTMGSHSHPNSQPPENITLRSFRIGVYPVVVRDYLAFTRESARDWVSPDGADPERLNAPATDLTWHDAREYCTWLTHLWRASGTIGPHEQVRLPTEPEWERAARGDQQDGGNEGLIYPWGTTWDGDGANCETTGFNTTCAVGLFPKGRSPYGSLDMAGHVWEWCSTLWGEDMATPSFRYPWRDDGREAPDATEKVRRVLRGGCFSSPKVKANCTYRGSLEPSGYWRGNGFRIVVAQVE